MRQSKRERRLPIKKAVDFLFSFELFISMVLCALFWSSISMYILNIGFWDALDFVPTKVFVTMLLIVRLAGFFREVRDRRIVAVASAGVVIVLGGFILTPLTGFDGLVALGEGERLQNYDRAVKGPLVEIPELPISIEKIKGDPLALDENSVAELRAGAGEIIALRRRQSAKLSSGHVVKVVDIGVAPAFEIRKNTGDLVASGAAMLKLYPRGEQDYFLNEILPHRFYLSLSGNEDKPLHLKVLRGKMMLVDEDIADEQVKFDDLAISFPKNNKWIVLQVRHLPSMWIIYLGIAVSLLGGALATALKRRA